MKLSYVSDTGSKGLNEDQIYKGKNLFAVFDGASNLLGPKTSGAESGGQIAANSARQVFADNPTAPLAELALAANSAVRGAQAPRGIDFTDGAVTWNTTIAAVRMHDAYFEYLSVGDSPIIAITKNGVAQQVGKAYDWDVESLKLWQELIKEGIEKPRHDPRMEAQLAKVRRLANIEYGYCNGDPAMEAFIDTGKVPLEDVTTIVIMTDGFMLPKIDPAAPDDWQEFAKLYQHGGLPKVLDCIRHLEKEDADCHAYPRFKTHDDASAVAVDLV